MIKRMLDPNPVTRVTIAGIKAHDWFKHDYTPSNYDDDDDVYLIQEDVRIYFYLIMLVPMNLDQDRALALLEKSCLYRFL